MYAVPLNIGKTAWKYDVQNTNIRQWKKAVQKMKTDFGHEKWNLINWKKNSGAGGPPKNKEIYPKLLDYLHGLRAQDRPVTTNFLCAEYCKLANFSMPFLTLRQRIYRFLHPK